MIPLLEVSFPPLDRNEEPVFFPRNVTVKMLLLGVTHWEGAGVSSLAGRGTM